VDATFFLGTDVEKSVKPNLMKKHYADFPVFRRLELIDPSDASHDNVDQTVEVVGMLGEKHLDPLETTLLYTIVVPDVVTKTLTVVTTVECDGERVVEHREREKKDAGVIGEFLVRVSHGCTVTTDR
jgi:hypothetical protein